MAAPVALHNLYYLIDTEAWLRQRTGAHDPLRSNQVQDFVRSEVFDDCAPALGITSRMQLWCTAQGWQIAEGAPIEHDDECLTKPVTIVLTTSGSDALALISVDGGAPQVYADVTTDHGVWHASSTIQISCPGGHGWTWDGDGYLNAADGAEQRVTALFGWGRSVISRCHECEAFDDDTTSGMCPCPGFAVYCPTCNQRCQVTLPEIATREPATGEDWIAAQIAALSNNELLLVKAVLDEIRAGRPVEHFTPGTTVYVDPWGTTEFVVQGTAPYFHENGVVSRKVEVRSKSGGLSGHVDPHQLRRVPPRS